MIIKSLLIFKYADNRFDKILRNHFYALIVHISYNISRQMRNKKKFYYALVINLLTFRRSFQNTTGIPYNLSCDIGQ
jgi:hypothetical protein